MVKKYRNSLLIFFLLLISINYFNNNIIKSISAKNKIHYIEYKEKKEEYLGILEIPKINLKKEFYDYLSTNNNVNKNIEVIETSKMPNEKNSNLILASHSGNSKISYFKNLHKLKEKDEAIIYYNGRKYVYQLLYVYSELKDGSLSIRKEKNTTNLTLITCDKKNNSLQNVYVFKLISD